MRCEQPAALVAKVGPLAMFNPQCMHHRGTLLCGQQSVQLQIALPPLYISKQLGIVIVLHVCSHLNSFFLVSCYFIFLYFNGFHYYHYCHHYFTLVYFDQPPLKVFQCDWCPCLCCLILFCLSLSWNRGSWLGCGYCWVHG